MDYNEIFTSFKLPKFSKYILISCWLASRNPENTDKKIFIYEKNVSKKNRKDT